MEFDRLRAYLLAKTGAQESAPFDPHTLIYQVGEQVFALVSRQGEPPHLTLRCEPAHAELLRAMYSAVAPGIHMNRRNWNTLTLDDTMAEAVLIRMIDTSYRLALTAGGTPDCLPAAFEEGTA